MKIYVPRTLCDSSKFKFGPQTRHSCSGRHLVPHSTHGCPEMSLESLFGARKKGNRKNCTFGGENPIAAGWGQKCSNHFMKAYRILHRKHKCWFGSQLGCYFLGIVRAAPLRFLDPLVSDVADIINKNKSRGWHLLPPPKSVRLWGVHRHRTGWRLVGVPFRSTLSTV